MWRHCNVDPNIVWPAYDLYSSIFLKHSQNSKLKKNPCVQAGACVGRWPLRDPQSATLHTWVLNWYWTEIMMHMIDTQLLSVTFLSSRLKANPCVQAGACVDRRPLRDPLSATLHTWISIQKLGKWNWLYVNSKWISLKWFFDISVW